MARPKKQATDTRARVVSFRVTGAEYTRLEAKANAVQQPLADYARRAALRGRVQVVKAPPALSVAAIAALNRLGVNLNQLARLGNATGAMPARLPELLGRINALLDQAMDLPDIDEPDGDDPAALTGE